MRSRAQVKSHPIHPFLVTFPIGLFITSFIFDLAGLAASNAGLYAVGWWCVIAGLCGGALAAIPGAIDLLSVVPANSSGRSRGYKHAVLNVAVLALFIAVAAHRAGPEARPDGLSLLLSGIGVLTLLTSGWLGATLVYRNQIGVDHRYANATKYRTVELSRWDQPVCNADELAPGQLLLADITGTRVAVGRCAEGIIAFADHCTHKGGPLSDGTLIGCTVQCPWHGSQFNVHTGKAVAGPAQDDIETFDAQVRDGQVYVRPQRKQENRAA